MQMTFEDALQWLKANYDIFPMLTPSKGKLYQCPFCGSGTHGSGTGAVEYYQETNTICCYSDGCKVKAGDEKAHRYSSIDVFMQRAGLNINSGADLRTAVFWMADQRGIEITDSTRPDQARKDPPKIKLENNNPRPKKREKVKPGPDADFSAYIKNCARHITDPAAVEYLTVKRGLSMDTIQRIQPPIGYDAASDPANAPGGSALKYEDGEPVAYFKARRIILPASNRFYMGRAIDSKTQVQKSNTPTGTELFNAAALDSDAAEIFVSEGAFTALAIMDAGGPEVEAVALNGTGGGKTLLQALAGRATDKVFVVCFDNEPIEGSTPEELEAAQSKHDKVKAAQSSLVKTLRAKGYNAIEYEINGAYNDANDRLRADRAGLVDAIGEAQRQAAAYKQEAHEAAEKGCLDFDAEIELDDEPEPDAAESPANVPNSTLTGNPDNLPADSEKTAQSASESPDSAQSNADKEQAEAAAARAEAAAAIDAQEAAQARQIFDLLAESETDRYKPIPTGIAAVDEALDGGLISKTIVFLGAQPGAGKTALATQIFESMARQGHKAIYFNLEMSRELIQARSLARIVYGGGAGPELKAVDILRGYSLDTKNKALVQMAAQDYAREIAPNLAYNPGGATSNLDALLKTMNEAADLAERAGRPAPNICIDYLQLLTGKDREDAQTVIKRAVLELKNYAMKRGAIVFVIVAQSREANRRNEARIDTGRDSSAIEYSGDLQLQLTVGDENIIGQNPKTDRFFHVTKNRYGRTTEKDGIPFCFHGGASYFEALDGGYLGVFDGAEISQDEPRPRRILR